MNESGSKPIRVLLVDDEQDLVDFLSHRLLKHGFTVTATTAGTEAIDAAATQKYDVAVVDLKMPVMDGIEVLEKLKEQQPFLKTIMLTGHGSHDSALEAGRLQAFHYLLKPYEFDELVSVIEKAASVKRKAQLAAFRAEQERVIDNCSTAMEITEATERLRKKYEQD
jgi:two-component system NtrC family response regulator